MLWRLRWQDVASDWIWWLKERSEFGIIPSTLACVERPMVVPLILNGKVLGRGSRRRKYYKFSFRKIEFKEVV